MFHIYHGYFQVKMLDQEKITWGGYLLNLGDYTQT